MVGTMIMIMKMREGVQEGIDITSYEFIIIGFMFFFSLIYSIEQKNKKIKNFNPQEKLSFKL